MGTAPLQSSKTISPVQVKLKKAFLVLSVTCLAAAGSQGAPIPGRRELIWNPHHYPTARSLSMPPTTTKVTTTSTTFRPRIKQKIYVPAASIQMEFPERRTSNSQSPANLEANMKESEKDQLKFDLGNATAVSTALNEFIRAAEVLVRELLISTNSGLLKVIGQVDQGIERFQKRLQSSGLRIALEGQKAAARTYEALPSFLTKLIHRLTTPAEGRSGEKLTSQLNDAVKNLRQLKKMLTDAFDEHEKDFHNVFQDRFTQVNQYLGVPELPKRPLAWYP